MSERLSGHVASPRRGLLPGAILLLVLLACGFPRGAEAVEGFDKLLFGMSPEDVRAVYPGQTHFDPEPRGQPAGTISGSLILTGRPMLFDSPVEVSCFFTGSGLAIIRLGYLKPEDSKLDELLDFYRPHWGDPLRSIARDGARKKVTWAWPWEGVELRAVEEDRRLRYARVDFSQELMDSWRTADAFVCTMLPDSSSCAFSDTLCHQQDSLTPRGERVAEALVSGSMWQIACVYQGYRLDELVLTVDRPDDAAADWLDQLLERRLGEGKKARKDEGGRVLISTRWASHQTRLRVVRRAVVRTESGWTGPVESIRLRREGVR